MKVSVRGNDVQTTATCVLYGDVYVRMVVCLNVDEATNFLSNTILVASSGHTIECCTNRYSSDQYVHDDDDGEFVDLPSAF